MLLSCHNLVVRTCCGLFHSVGWTLEGGAHPLVVRVRHRELLEFVVAGGAMNHPKSCDGDHPVNAFKQENVRRLFGWRRRARSGGSTKLRGGGGPASKALAVTVGVEMSLQSHLRAFRTSTAAPRGT